MTKQGLTTLKELLDSADNKHIPNRHELCYCGSGKKYKYCCEEKDKKLTTPVGAIEFNVTDEPYVLLGKELPDKDEAEFIAIFDRLNLDPPQINEQLISDLLALAKKTSNPFIWENLHEAYILSGNLEQALAIENAIKTRFSGCFYARFLKSVRALEEKRLQDFEACFDFYSNLPMLYPERKAFHFSEAKMFHFQWLTYYTLLSDLHRAEGHFIPLEALLDHDDPALIRAQEYIKALRKDRKAIIRSNRQQRLGYFNDLL